VVNGDASGYTVKELIALVVIPKLDELTDSIKEKADDKDLIALRHEVEELRKQILTPSQVESQFGELFQSYKARGFRSWEVLAGVILLVFNVLAFFLNLWVATSKGA
jgi:hypothetical protein